MVRYPEEESKDTMMSPQTTTAHPTNQESMEVDSNMNDEEYEQYEELLLYETPSYDKCKTDIASV